MKKETKKSMVKKAVKKTGKKAVDKAIEHAVKMQAVGKRILIKKAKKVTKQDQINMLTATINKMESSSKSLQKLVVRGTDSIAKLSSSNQKLEARVNSLKAGNNKFKKSIKGAKVSYTKLQDSLKAQIQKTEALQEKLNSPKFMDHLANFRQARKK